MLSGRSTGSYGSDAIARRRSTHSDLLGESVARRLSEAGVNRSPSAAQILTEDTSQFAIGQSVYVDGVNPGRIQYIGETKFGPGDWAGVVLDEPLGKNDGSVGKTEYFQCEPGYGIFSRLFRLTREPIENAEEVRGQMKRYGYEIMDAPVGRKGSVGSGGGRRGSSSADNRRGSTGERASMSPRPTTPDQRRSSLNRSSPGGVEPRRTSLTVPERRGSQGNSPMGRRTPGKSPLASPRTPRSQITGGDVRIKEDPDMTKLAQEARRLSMGHNHINTGRQSPPKQTGEKRPSISKVGNGTSRNGASSAGTAASNRLFDRRQSSDHKDHTAAHRQADSKRLFGTRRPSSDAHTKSHPTRKTSDADSSPARDPHCELHRKPSSELSSTDLERRRLSEAGVRRASQSGDVVLNHDTGSLMVGMPVWVDGNKHGRIAFLGEVHFVKGLMAGVHLESPIGKNNGSVGGVMYFQCEPKHGVFARPHRLTREPLITEE